MGSVVISVEVGAGWATSRDDGVADERDRETLDAWRRASYLFDRHEVPATWLVAGHLFGPVGRGGTLADREGPEGTDETPATRRAAGGERAGSPERTDEGRTSSDDRNADGGPASDRQGAGRDAGDEPDASPCVHPDQQRPSRDSATDRARLAQSGRNLIAGLTRSRVAHEIGCVPFSELDVEDASQETAVETVRATIDAAAELGVETEAFRAFAFPGDPGHGDVLAAYGFECYREPEPPTDGRLSTLTTLVGVLARRLPGTGPRLVEPETDEHGMVAMPTSASLFPLGGRSRALARVGRGDPVAELVKRGVDRADGGDGVFHLALRPEDLRTEADFERLEAVLAHVAARRGRPGLAVETMGEVARRLGEYAATPTTAIR